MSRSVARWAPCLALLFLCGAADPPAVWIDRLAAEATRADAYDALEAAGVPALLDLRSAAAKGGETGRLASDLIRKIGARRLLRATLVTPDIADRPVPDAVAELARISGLAIDPTMPRGSAFSAKDVSLRAAGPIGFLEALDRLGVAGGFRQDASSSWTPSFEAFSGTGKPGGQVKLGPIGTAPAPMSYAGPYRVTLLGLYRSRTSEMVLAPKTPDVVEDFRAQLEVAAEPGILLVPNGPIRVQEAVDDAGRSLRPVASAPPDPVGNELFGWSLDRVGAFVAPIPMRLPADRGRVIARLRGFLPIVAMTRTDELIAASISELDGKTLRGGGVSLTASRVATEPRSLGFELAIRGESPTGQVGFAAGPRQATQAILTPPFNPLDHLRIEDADGHAIPVSANPTAPTAPDGTMTFQVTCSTFGRVPARLKYFAVAAVATEIPFEFSALPIP